MPLCSEHLPEETVKFLTEMPLDKSCLTDDIPYQTKVEIYDTKCSGCGFARIILHNKRGQIFTSNNINEILIKAINISDIIVRSCSWPEDISIVNGKPVYPTVTEIVSNTCKFWREEKLFMFEENEEYEQYTAERLSKLGDIRESIFSEDI